MVTLKFARHLIPIYVSITVFYGFVNLSGVPGLKAFNGYVVISTSGFDITSYDATNIFIVEGIIVYFYLCIKINIYT